MTASNIATLPVSRSGFDLTPKTLSEAMEFASVVAKSSIVPKDYQGNPGNCIIAMQWGAEIGLAPLQAMQSIAVINGRPSIWGDAMLALVRGSGLLESIVETPGDTQCTCTLKRRGEPEVSRTFTMEDAKRAGLAGKQGPWSQYPKRMLQLRARAFALRDVFPDVLRGVNVAEEAQDMPAERHMGAVDEVKPDALAVTHDRASKVKAAIAARKTTPALSSPALADVMAAIGSSETLEALKNTADLAATLQDDDDRKAARTAYKARQADLKAGDGIDPATGEIKRTYAQIADAITKARDADAAALELDSARDELPQEQFEELAKHFAVTWQA